MREIDVRDKVRALGVAHPEWSFFERVGNLTKLRADATRGYHAVNYESGLLLYALVAHHRPQRILEIGTGRGFASLCMAQALEDGGRPGRIVTVDVRDQAAPQEWAIDEGDGPRVASLSRKEVWERHFSPPNLSRIEPRQGDSRTVLPQLRREGLRFDLVYIDGDHTYSAVAHDFYSSLRLVDRPFRMLLDDYTPLSHLYGVRRLVDRAVAPVFDAELIFTEGRWAAAKDTPALDQGQVLIDSERLHRPLEQAYPSAATAARLFGYRRFGRVFDWLDQAQSPAVTSMRYGFGRNWEEFVDHHFDETRVEQALAHMLGFLRLPSLDGRSFLDIGSGSGLHSLAALRAGARRIVSFDYDTDSVRTTLALRARAGNPEHWTVTQGSVLDSDFMRGLEPADVVYSWGVLHHTGEMWKAIENAAQPLAADGVFYLALYTSDVFTRRTPDYWLQVKRRYNNASRLGKRMMEWSYACRDTVVPALLRGRNPWPILAGRDQGRGMTYWTDVRDWLGGWPMEFAGIAETKAFGAGRGLELLNISAGEANTEYLFRHRGRENYWDGLLAARRMEILARPFEHRQGHAYAVTLDAHRSTADVPEAPRRSPLMLYEDGVPVGFAHQPLAQIVTYGRGRYGHWHGELIFSSTDRSDPNANGREYAVCADFGAQPAK